MPGTFNLPLPPFGIDVDAATQTPLYTGEALRRDLGALVAPGSSALMQRGGILDSRAMVVSLSGSDVRVANGGCLVPSSKGMYFASLAAVATVGTLTAADPTNPRVDRVILRVQDPGTGGTTARKGVLELIDGTPAASPGLPAVSGSTAYIDLGRIDVPKVGGGSPSVTQLVPLTAAAGGIIPVRNVTEMNALPKLPGLSCYRIDTVQHLVCNGVTWVQPSRVAPAMTMYLGAASTDIPNAVYTMPSGWIVDTDAGFTSWPAEFAYYSDGAARGAGIKATVAGVYRFSGSTTFNGSTAGGRFVKVNRNTTTLIRTALPPVAGRVQVLSATTTARLNAGDTMTFQAYQDSGVALAILGADTNKQTTISVEYLGT